MMSFLETVDAWLGYKELNEGRSRGTVVKYRGYLRQLDAFLGQGRALEATRQELEQFVGLHMHKQGLSPRSRRALVAAVRGFFGWAHKQGIVREDPARSLPYPRAGLRLPVPLSLEHAERLLMQPDISTFRGLRDATMIGVLIGCGLRVSGLCNLNEGDLRWGFDHQQNRELLVIRAREKGRKERLVPAPDETRLLLRAYLGHEHLEGIDRLLTDGDKVLFVSLRNRLVTEDQYYGEARRLTPSSVYSIVLQYGLAAGIPRAEAHPHALRHLYGTELAEAGVDLLIIQQLLGHEKADTSRIYIHLADRRLREATDKANPLAKVRTPVSDLATYLRKQAKKKPA